jgi:hypothetical protein
MASEHGSPAIILSAVGQERIDQAADALCWPFADVPADNVSDWRWAAEAARVLKAALVAAGLHEAAGLVTVGRIAPTVWVQPLDRADARALAALIDRALLAVGGWPAAAGTTQGAKKHGVLPDVADSRAQAGDHGCSFEERLRATFAELIASVAPRDCATAVDALLRGPFPPLSRMTGPGPAHRRALRVCAMTASGRPRWITRAARRRPPRFAEPAGAGAARAHTPVEEHR